MAHFLTLLARQAVQTAQSNTWATADKISFASVIVAAVFGLGGIVTAIVALMISKRSNDHTKELAMRMDASEEPMVALEDVNFDSQALANTLAAQCTVSNRSRLPDAIMSANVAILGVDIKPFMESQIFICNQIGDTFRPDYSNQKNWPHVYPVKVDSMSSVTYKFWFFAQGLTAQKMYPPSDHPVEIKVVLKTMRGQTLEKRIVYAAPRQVGVALAVSRGVN